MYELTENPCFHYYKIIENEHPFDIPSFHPEIISNLLKLFLHNLPDALLCRHLYNDWVKASRISDEKNQLIELLKLCEKLPKQNFVLLQYILKISDSIKGKYTTVPDSYWKHDSSVIAYNIGFHMLWPTHPCKRFYKTI